MHGICHFCCAGMATYPFSDCGASPRFMKSVGSAAAQLWHSSPAPFTRILPNDQRCPERLYRPDIWHNYHLGLGRYFLSSSLVVMLPLWPGSSVPHKLEAMTISWKAYCRMKKKKPILQKFTREVLGFQGAVGLARGKLAEGCHNHFVTRTLSIFGLLFWYFWFFLVFCVFHTASSMKCQILPILQEWLEHEMRKPYLKMQLDGDPRNVLILLALKNANSLFSLLFSAGAWLDEAQARAVGSRACCCCAATGLWAKFL